jgi:hypothetical protein
MFLVSVHIHDGRGRVQVQMVEVQRLVVQIKK